ncbi:MAG: hypothetical protein LUC47_09780, partial [Clostridiales bacterium]|nr:hypothetical protein [Clostridiales bacterium]
CSKLVRLSMKSAFNQRFHNQSPLLPPLKGEEDHAKHGGGVFAGITDKDAPKRDAVSLQLPD